MTARDVFLVVFAIPCIVSILLSYLAAKSKRDTQRALCFIGAIFFFWAGLALASDLGFRAWQSIPDAPPEAFNDSGPAAAMLMGWLPATVFCFLIYIMARVPEQILRHTIDD